MRRKNAVAALAILLWTTWLLGQVFRDSTWLTGMFFYIPSPVLFLFLLVCSWHAWRTHHRFVSSLPAGMALLPLFFVLCVENRLISARPENVNADTLRLVHWNVARGHLGWNGIETALRQHKADICVLSEVPTEVDIVSTARSFGEVYTSVRFGNMAVIANGSLLNGHWLQLEGGLKAYGVTWESPHGICKVMVVDLAANIRLAREPRLVQARSLMVDFGADIVAGDFNAPRRSRALSPLPAGFSHAYEVAGSGCSYTWPVPCPVYSIDQCILGQRIKPLSYDLESSWRSDHRRQVLDFTIEGQ